MGRFKYIWQNIYQNISDKSFLAMGEWYSKYEPRHDKSNKMTLRPAKTHISLGIRPVWSEFSLSVQKSLGP